MIDAGTFANRGSAIREGDKSFFRFGLNDPKELAATIRNFAAQVENGTIVIQKVQSGAVSDLADFTLRAIMIDYAVREPSK